MKKLFIVIALFPLFIQAQDSFIFEENKNQYPSHVYFKAEINEATVCFFENSTFTFSTYDKTAIVKNRFVEDPNDFPNVKNKKRVMHDFNVKTHHFKKSFLDANTNVKVGSENPSSSYKNFFIGNNSSRWASNVKDYEKVIYKELYDGIDMIHYVADGNYKYDFIVAPNSNPYRIQFQYDGIDEPILQDGEIKLQTAVGLIREGKPFSYQIINGEKIIIESTYRLENGVFGFEFPNGYDKNYPLVIDPFVYGTTYTGNTSTISLGLAATYDASGNAYSANRSYGAGYPTSVGVYDVSFNGATDIAVTKFNPNTSAVIWSTYHGGTSSDWSISIVTNSSDEVYCFGATFSDDFATLPTSLDPTYNGDYEYVVAHYNSTGTALIGSTYLGGNGSEYVDGEIIVDALGKAHIVGTMSSTDFPTTAGAYDVTLFGGEDGFYAKMSADLSTMEYCTLMGGNNGDYSRGIDINSAGEIYIGGYTFSNDFPTSAGSYDLTFGGTTECFIMKFSPTGVFMNSSFLGNSDNDVIRFVDVSHDDKVYVMGFWPSIPPTAGTYSIAGGSAFVARFNSSLSALEFGTKPCAGGNEVAFGVDECDNIYLACYNTAGTNPTTPDAFFSTPQGGFFFQVLGPNAATHEFSSYYYGNNFDGGHGRFDLNGTLYASQTVNDGFAITPPWAFKNNVGVPTQDALMMRVNISPNKLNAEFTVNPDDTVCTNQLITFNNTSTGNHFSWNFGDGVNSNAVNPTHTYTTNGSFTVTLITTDSILACKIPDTLTLTITVVNQNTNVSFTYNDTICTGEVVNFDGVNLAEINSWNFGDGATSNLEDPSHMYMNTGNYTITYIGSSANTCFTADTATGIVTVVEGPSLDLGEDQVFCNTITPVLLDGGTNPLPLTYLWNTGASTQTILVSDTGTYYLTVQNAICPIGVTDTIKFTFDQGFLSSLIVPNIFTPNGDGVNDEYFLGSFSFDEFELVIYDRYGNRVFETNDAADTWKGKVNNQDAMEAVYYYVLRVKSECENDGNDYIARGFLNLFR